MSSVLAAGHSLRKQGKARPGIVTSAKQGRFIEGNRTLDTVTMSPGNNTLDTVTMAREEREKYGPWEAELSYGGEVDLHRHLNDCKKNPGHLKFVPVDQFNVEHLPPGYHDDELVDLVRAMSDLTVRVSVKYVSDGRPETFAGTDTPYPHYRDRGSDLMRVGTGWVRWVEKYSNGGETCWCEGCLSSGSPRTEFGLIKISTAGHVVYDGLEAAHTTCHLFFDRGPTPEACSGVVTLRGGAWVRGDVEGDWCEMRYVTHDLELTDRLDEVCGRYVDVTNHWREIGIMINRRRQLDQLPPLPRFTILVSHPHGCSKQVSVGWARAQDRDPPRGDKCIYTAATCPGSSGAHVWVVGQGYWSAYGRVHTGNWEEDKTMNFCNCFFWYDSDPDSYSETDPDSDPDLTGP